MSTEDQVDRESETAPAEDGTAEDELGAESGDGSEEGTERECVICGDVFVGKGRARYCSDECKLAARRQARATRVAMVPPAPVRPVAADVSVEPVARQRGSSPYCPLCGGGMAINKRSTNYPRCVHVVRYWRCLADGCTGTAKTTGRE